LTGASISTEKNGENGGTKRIPGKWLNHSRGILRCENKTILGFSFYVMFYYVTSREKALRINLTENTL